MGKISQSKQILEYMQKNNGITPIDALKICGCFRLSGRIFDLREQGYDIKTTMEQTPNGARIARYTLDEERGQR